MRPYCKARLFTEKMMNSDGADDAKA